MKEIITAVSEVMGIPAEQITRCRPRQARGVVDIQDAKSVVVAIARHKGHRHKDIAKLFQKSDHTFAIRQYARYERLEAELKHFRNAAMMRLTN